MRRRAVPACYHSNSYSLRSTSTDSSKSSCCNGQAPSLPNHALTAYNRVRRCTFSELLQGEFQILSRLPRTRRQLSVKADSACGGKPHPSTHLLICCTGITPYNVIIHPDPGFVKYFLKFQHNNPAIYGTRPELPPDSSGNASYSAREQQNIFDFNRNPVFP